ncbi:MAG: hypothetical protein EBU46_19380, partial [Nitrosomonadaceae bacterium]|nr:hypothetical protein [Nitrosomonadaceae bacterium]
ISTHYTVTDQNGTWDEGEVRITVTGDRVYEGGGQVIGTLPTAVNSLFIRNTSGDDALDVNLTQGLRVVGKDSSGRIYFANWTKVESSMTVGDASVGQMHIHRMLTSGLVDSTYEVNLPLDNGVFYGASSGSIRVTGVSDSGSVYVLNSLVDGTTKLMPTLERYLSTSTGISSGTASAGSVVNKDAGYTVTIDAGWPANVVTGLDGSTYVGSFKNEFNASTNSNEVSLEVARYNSSGVLDSTWLPSSQTHKLVVNGSSTSSLNFVRGLIGIDDHVYVSSFDSATQISTVTRYTSAGVVDTSYAIKLPGGALFRNVDANNKVYVQRTLSDGALLLERYSPTVVSSGVATQTASVLDTTFGTNGQIVLPVNATALIFPRFDQILVYNMAEMVNGNTPTAIPPTKIYSASTGSPIALTDAGWSLNANGSYALDPTSAAFDYLAKDAPATTTLNYKTITLGSGST